MKKCDDVFKSAKEFIAKNSFDPSYGARPIKRAIQREIETPIAKAILKGEYAENKIVRIDIDQSGENLSIS